MITVVCTDVRLTIENEANECKNSYDQRSKHIAGCPRMNCSAPCKAKQEEEEAGNIKEDSAEIHVSNFVHDSTVAVKVVEIRWVIEEHPTDR